jgi:membrane protein required for beta-lactamase induction
MTFISILVALVAERFLESLRDLRSGDWFGAYTDWLRSRLGEHALWDGPVGVLAVLFPVMLVLWLLVDVFHGAMYGLPGFVFGVLVLLYCLGPNDLDEQGEAFVAALEGEDETEARRIARGILGVDPPAQAFQWSTAVARGIFAQVHDRLFGVLFWFVVLGPIGALLYRLSVLLRERVAGEGGGAEGFDAAAVRLHEIMAWIPARLVVAGFALAGSFEDTVSGWRNYRERCADSIQDAASALLVCGGFGALQVDTEIDPAVAVAPDEDHLPPGAEVVHAALGLIWRTLIVWLAVLALVTVAGWLG